VDNFRLYSENINQTNRTMKKPAKITDIEKAINRLNFLEMPYIYRDGKIIVDVVSDINYDSIRVIVSDESILKLAKEWS
jgi:nitrate reductase NapAB chaperone NapD